MLTLLLSWLYIGALSLVFGIGGFRLAAALLRSEQRPGSLSPDYPLLLGFLLLTTLTAYLSLITPINWVAHLLLAGSAAILAFRLRPDPREWWHTLRTGWSAAGTPFRVGAALLFGLALQAFLIENDQTDSRLYHVQAIQWIREYAVVPGLGNVHGRFAFNSHYFLPTAFFSSFFSTTRMLFPLFSFFFLVVLLRMLYVMDAAVREKSWQRFSLYALLMLIFVYQTVQRLSSTSTDDITCILVFYTFFQFLEAGFRPGRQLQVFLLWVIVLTAVTFKLSSVFLLVLLPFTFRLFDWRKLVLVGSLGLLIILPFLVRNVILSGYLVYPYPDLDLFNVEWKIPREAVVYEKELVEGWARLPHPPVPESEAAEILKLSFTDWFRQWWPAQTLRWKAILLLNLAPFLLLPFLLYRRQYRMAVICLTIVVNLLFWFLKAPDPRFVYGFLFFGLALGLSYVLAPLLRLVPPGRLLVLALPAALLMVPYNKGDVEFADDLQASLLLYPNDLETIETDEFAAQNVRLRVPRDGNLLCFNTPLPCTPYPNRGLALRGRDFQAGFMVLPGHLPQISTK